MKRITGFVLAMMLTVGTGARAALYILSATDSGWYDSTGFHDAANDNYIAGEDNYGVLYRDFFVWAIPNLPTYSTVVGAQMSIYNPSLSTGAYGNGFSSPQGTETYAVYHVSTSISQLSASQAGATSIYNDLGSGTTYGSVTVNSSVNGQFVNVTLNSSAITAIQSAAGTSFAIGGAITTINGPNEFLFGYSNNNSRRLELTTANANIGANNVSFGAVRVGTSATGNLTVQNTGDSGSTLTGTIGSSSNGDFTPGSGMQAFSLGAGATSVRTFTYTPTSRGSESATIAINNNRANTTRTLSGTAVGPVFSSSLTLGGTLDFGDVNVGDTGTEGLILQNTTTDIGYSDALTGLTLLSYAITGTDASMFSLTGFTAGEVLSQGELLNLNVLFSPTGASMSRTAMITFYTDLGASYGASGQSFSFNLQGNAPPAPAAVPEPGLAGLWLVGGVVLWRYRAKSKVLSPESEVEETPEL